MFAIAPKGISKRVGARRIRPDWPLADGESFTVADWREGLVLADDGISLREGTADELTKNPPLASWQEERKRLYRERIAAYKGRPNATHIDVLGFIEDAQVSKLMEALAATGIDPGELGAIASIIQQVKADVPKPSNA